MISCSEFLRRKLLHTYESWWIITRTTRFWMRNDKFECQTFTETTTLVIHTFQFIIICCAANVTLRVCFLEINSIVTIYQDGTHLDFKPFPSIVKNFADSVDSMIPWLSGWNTVKHGSVLIAIHCHESRKICLGNVHSIFSYKTSMKLVVILDFLIGTVSKLVGNLL